MKNKYILKLNLIFLSFVLFPSFSFTQTLDASVIQNLSSEKISEGLELINSKKTSIDSSPKIIPRDETLSKKQLIEDINLFPDRKYGYSFISSQPTSIVATGDLPLPNEYKISIKDQISIILSGSRDATFILEVKLDGTIQFPELGAISVIDKTLGELKENLSSLINRSYIGVKIDVSIANLSAKKISIVGAVKMPGTYLVNPFSTITSALGYSGGVSELGTLRNIKLKRINGQVFDFDLYDLLINGDRSGDITIESGDVIIIEAANQFIKLSGAVVRPAIYEIKSGETLLDLLKHGLGFQQIANKSNINVRRVNIELSLVEDVNVDDLSADLKNVISVNVFPYINKIKSGINVFGAIKEPGYYELKENDTLEKIIEKLDFINVYPWLGVLEQFDDNQLIKTTVLFNLNDPKTYKSVKLLPNSKIHFADVNNIIYNVDPSTQKLINEYSLVINHKEKRFTLPVFGNYSVKSFIDLLGLDMSDVNEEATYLSPLENEIKIMSYKEMKFNAKKFNVVTFRSPINDLISVTISGAIDYPGSYTLKANSSIEDLYELIGDFKSEAFKNGIVLTRSSVRERQLKSIERSRKDLTEALITSVKQGENINDIRLIQSISDSIEPENLGRIAGNFSPGSKASNNTILINGDAIIVPKNPNVINVLGEVLNPVAFEYSKKLNIFQAISTAGGYKDYADKSKIYVIKANGIVQRQRKSAFTKLLTFGIFPRRVKLEPGDTIVVPRKIITNNPGIQSLLPITQLLSDFAFSAAAIDSLRD